MLAAVFLGFRVRNMSPVTDTCVVVLVQLLSGKVNLPGSRRISMLVQQVGSLSINLCPAAGGAGRDFRVQSLDRGQPSPTLTAGLTLTVEAPDLKPSPLLSA